MKTKIDPKIFKAYDIRGIYPDEINEEAAKQIAKAFAKFLNAKPIVVGYDMRDSSRSIHKACISALSQYGIKVYDVDLTSTPMLYFAVPHLNADGGIMITASHNPPKYNGFKLVRVKAIPISEKSGIEEIKNLVLEGLQPTRRPPGRHLFKTIKKGKVVKKEVLKEYVRFNLKDFNLKKILPLKIVVDTANAVPGIVVPEFFKKINCFINILSNTCFTSLHFPTGRPRSRRWPATPWGGFRTVKSASSRRRNTPQSTRMRG